MTNIWVLACNPFCQNPQWTKYRSKIPLEGISLGIIPLDRFPQEKSPSAKIPSEERNPVGQNIFEQNPSRKKSSGKNPPIWSQIPLGQNTYGHSPSFFPLFSYLRTYFLWKEWAKITLDKIPLGEIPLEKHPCGHNPLR